MLEYKRSAQDTEKKGFRNWFIREFLLSLGGAVSSVFEKGNYIPNAGSTGSTEYKQRTEILKD